MVAPGDQVVQVLHHDAVLVGEVPRPRDRMGLERLGRDRVVAVQDVVLALLLVGRQLRARRAQQCQTMSSIRLRLAVLAEGEELPEALGWSRRSGRSRSDRRCSGTSAAPRRIAGSCSGAPRSSVGCGRTAPSCSWRTVRASETSISLGKDSTVTRADSSGRRVVEEVVRQILLRIECLEALLPGGVQHAGQRVPVQLRDQLADERMEEVLEGVA